MENLYEILELTPSASADDIKKNYRKLAVKYHPDRNQGNKIAEDKMKHINRAYEVLSSVTLKSAYDRKYREYKNPPASSSPFSGNAAKSKFYSFEQWGEFLSRILNSEINDVFNDLFSDNDTQNHIWVIVASEKEVSQGFYAKVEYKNGIYYADCRLEFLPGVKNGSTYCQPNCVRNTMNQKIDDLYIRVFIKEQIDIVQTQQIKLSLAVNGGPLLIQTEKGPIKINLPPFTFSGKLFKLKTYGKCDIETGVCGDLYIKIIVEIPINPTAVEQIQIDKLVNKMKSDE